MPLSIELDAHVLLAGDVGFEPTTAGLQRPRLYTTELIPYKQRWQGSNLKPSGSEPDALPIELHRYGAKGKAQEWPNPRQGTTVARQGSDPCSHA